MSDNSNHKKVADITAACIGDKKLILKIYFKIMRDCPSAIVNAFESLKVETISRSISRLPLIYICPDCKEHVSAIGIAGACIKCDPAGFDVPY